MCDEYAVGRLTGNKVGLDREGAPDNVRCSRFGDLRDWPGVDELPSVAIGIGPALLLAIGGMDREDLAIAGLIPEFSDE